MLNTLNNLKTSRANSNTQASEAESRNPVPTIEDCQRKMSAGDLDGAEQDARFLLSQSPFNGEVYYCLGMLSYHRGDLAGALTHLEKAAELSPDSAEIQNQYGNALRVHDRFNEAMDRYRLAAGLKSDYAAPYFNMGLVMETIGHSAEAADYYQKALDINPIHSAALIRLGNICLEQKNYLEAEALFRNELQRNPEGLEALNNLGLALLKLKRCDEAQQMCRRALLIDPNSAAVHNTFGIALRDSGHLDEAIASYRRALELSPDIPNILNNLGSALRENGQLPEAIATLRHALALKPDYAIALHNLGISLRETGQLEDAVSAFRSALAVSPTFAAAFNDLGGALTAQGDINNAVEAYRNAVSCDSNFFLAYSNMLLTMQYSPLYTATDLFQASRRYEELFGGAQTARFKNDPDPQRRLRIGYVSPDFKRHSVSYFFKALFANHSRAAVSVYCYSDVLLPDSHTYYYRNNSDCWRSIVGLGDDSVAKMVVEDQIDILVDLAGHTSQRMPLFARKPAPVEVTWLGYPDTTGLSVVDYRFSDSIADPVGNSDRFCAEEIYRLPDGFLCYTAPADAPEVVPLPAVSRGIITFGSFNNIAKITPEAIDLWCQLLERVPGAQLVIKNHSMADVAVRSRYEAFFRDRGIALDRVELRPWAKETVSHLAIYGEIDIALDTFPYNGTTTTCEALWMGVPVVTLVGDRHAGRVGHSILSRVGLSDLACDSPTAYLETATALAHDMKRLARIRGSLRKSMLSSTLCDGAGFAAAVETAYRLFWQKWCDSELHR